MKNQISVEYLGTFGWIMLVVMVTILALAQFGILDLSSEFPEECYLGEQIDCKKQYLDENGNLVLTLESKLNKQVEIIDFEIEGYYININNCSSTILPTDEEVNIICTVTDVTGSPQLFVENRQQFDLNLELLPQGSSDSFNVDGSIVSDVIDQDISTAFNCGSVVSGGVVCDYEWQCSGNVAGDDIYLGNDICCEGTCIENPCASGAGGVCCNSNVCTGPQGAYNGECTLTGKVCCTSCSGGGGRDDDDRPGHI